MANNLKNHLRWHLRFPHCDHHNRPAVGGGMFLTGAADALVMQIYGFSCSTWQTFLVKSKPKKPSEGDSSVQLPQPRRSVQTSVSSAFLIFGVHTKLRGRDSLYIWEIQVQCISAAPGQSQPCSQTNRTWMDECDWTWAKHSQWTQTGVWEKLWPPTHGASNGSGQDGDRPRTSGAGGSGGPLLTSSLG